MLVHGQQRHDVLNISNLGLDKPRDVDTHRQRADCAVVLLYSLFI